VTTVDISPSIYADRSALMEAAATRIVELAGDAIARAGRFTFVLAGGSTPRALYTLLASERFAKRVDWARVHFFWGDERCVPPDDTESNYGMARETLLDAVKPPPTNVHRMLGEEDPLKAAADYEALLHRFFEVPSGGAAPRFDLVLLGMGANGHTASLFPGTPPLHEQKRWVMASHVDAVAAWRLTLTPVVINAAANIVFLVAGAEKAARLHEVLHGKSDPDRLPAQLIHPAHGDLRWMVDAAATAPG
jgi:6-phosphogluconolactonase